MCDVTYGGDYGGAFSLRLESIKRSGVQDGRNSEYHWKVYRSRHLDRHGQNVNFREMLRIISSLAVEELSSTIRCCVKHVLIGRYDGTECVGLRPTSSEPSTSSASAPASEAG